MTEPTIYTIEKRTPQGHSEGTHDMQYNPDAQTFETVFQPGDEPGYETLHPPSRTPSKVLPVEKVIRDPERYVIVRKRPLSEYLSVRQDEQEEYQR